MASPRFKHCAKCNTTVALSVLKCPSCGGQQFAAGSPPAAPTPATPPPATPRVASRYCAACGREALANVLKCPACGSSKLTANPPAIKPVSQPPAPKAILTRLKLPSLLPKSRPVLGVLAGAVIAITGIGIGVSGGINRPSPPAVESVADLAPLLRASVVLVLSGKSIGTGFFITTEFVVTNRHVIDQDVEGGRVLVTNRAMGRVQVGHVVASVGGQRTGGNDFAVIRIDDGPVLSARPLSLAAEPAALREVVAAGFPGAIITNDRDFAALRNGNWAAAPEVVLTRGEVSAVQNRDSGLPVIAHTAAISSGNSGGPLVDRCGRAVGINTFVTRAEAGASGGFAIGASGLAKFLKSVDANYQWAATQCAK